MAILCCVCGVQIESNAMNMCASCVAAEVDVSDGIELTNEMYQCKGCLRYAPKGKGQGTSSYGSAWLYCEWESAELMALCLKHVHGLNKAKLVDAAFVWTEPHSKRIKVKLTLQREVAAAHASVQNTCVVTFVVNNAKCPDCTKQYHDHTWRALVQVRQKTSHKRTMFRLEQEILKHDAHSHAIGIQTVKDGMDFYFGTRSVADRFVQFLGSCAPIRSKHSTKLISEDKSQGSANLQTTLSVEVASVCKDDLLILPKKVANACRNISPLVLCSRTTSLIHLVDPMSGAKAELSSDRFWSNYFEPLETSPHLSEFFVLDVEPLDDQPSPKFTVADIEVARESDFGVNDTTFIVRSHLGGLLSSGDSVKGYDMTTSNISTNHLRLLERSELPDIILVRKVIPKEARANKKKRERQLKTLQAERRGKMSKAEEAKLQADFADFSTEYMEEQDEEYLVSSMQATADGQQENAHEKEKLEKDVEALDLNAKE